VVVDLSGVQELRGVKATTGGGLEIGAGTTLTEVVRHPMVKEKFPILAEAAGLVASPQIRNQGTIGGNVSQDTRCWYYRAAGPATAQAETSATRTRRRPLTASTRFLTRAAAWL
jgi:xanthine dehydrogenase YagS FAD-binding subunit